MYNSHNNKITMTEDETFKTLRRTPIEIVDKEMDQEGTFWSRSEEEIEEWFRKRGWIESEFNEEYIKNIC